VQNVKINNLKLALTGHMKARITQENAPERLMNKPNFGMLCANIPDIMIIKVLKIMFFTYG
jgi:hypothetical protein